jgi:hypothetical protein
MSKERAAKVMQEIFSKGTYEGDLLGINEGVEMSDTPRTDVAQHNMGSVAEPHYVVDVEVAHDLERELAEARKDAERYRWLRGDKRGRSLSVSSLEWTGNAELSDAAVDAAMKEGK